jgi:HSP90 family molecular chaperone
MTVLETEKKQNLTVSLTRNTLQKARVLAARRSTSISKLLAEQIESLVGEEEAYEQAMREALALMKKGFHLGGKHTLDRDGLHER